MKQTMMRNLGEAIAIETPAGVILLRVMAVAHTEGGACQFDVSAPDGYPVTPLPTIHKESTQ